MTEKDQTNDLKDIQPKQIEHALPPGKALAVNLVENPLRASVSLLSICTNALTRARNSAASAL
jgi:hypothetical protein